MVPCLTLQRKHSAAGLSFRFPDLLETLAVRSDWRSCWSRAACAQARRATSWKSFLFNLISENKGAKEEFGGGTMCNDVAPHAWSPHDFPHSEEETKARPKPSLATSSSYRLFFEVWLHPPLFARLRPTNHQGAASLRSRLPFRCTCIPSGRKLSPIEFLAS